jgi:hypothetical protein
MTDDAVVAVNYSNSDIDFSGKQQKQASHRLSIEKNWNSCSFKNALTSSDEFILLLRPAVIYQKIENISSLYVSWHACDGGADNKSSGKFATLLYIIRF